MNRRTNFSDFSTLNKYNNNNLGLPRAVNKGVQIVPTFRGFSYLDPNYNSLNTSGGFSQYSYINSSYLDDPNKNVNYVDRKCKDITTPEPTMTVNPIYSRK